MYLKSFNVIQPMQVYRIIQPIVTSWISSFKPHLLGSFTGIVFHQCLPLSVRPLRSLPTPFPIAQCCPVPEQGTQMCYGTAMATPMSHQKRWGPFCVGTYDNARCPPSSSSLKGLNLTGSSLGQECTRFMHHIPVLLKSQLRCLGSTGDWSMGSFCTSL